MKKHVKILTAAAIVCLLAGVLIYSGCKKAELFEDSNSTELVAEAPSYNNPFDWVGMQHNDAMDAVTAWSNFPTMSFEERAEKVYDYFQTAYSGDILMSFDEYFADLLAKIESEGEFADSLQISHILDGLEAEGVMSNKMKTLFLKLESDMQKAKDLDKLNAYLKTFENNVNNRNDISELERDQLLASTAFAKYSASYWVNVLDDTTHPWYLIVRAGNDPGDPPGEFKHWWKDLKAWIKELFDDDHYCGGTISDFNCAVAHANDAGAGASNE